MSAGTHRPQVEVTPRQRTRRAATMYAAWVWDRAEMLADRERELVCSGRVSPELSQDAGPCRCYESLDRERVAARPQSTYSGFSRPAEGTPVRVRLG
jgi:hypothetical protein